MSPVVERVLLVDSYDSFTFNLAALCRKAAPDCCIHIIKNDQLTFSDLSSYTDYFSAIIVGPGPGSPDIPEDIGAANDLWRVDNSRLVPIFGVCLGLQSLATQYGGKIKRLPVVKHGQVSVVEHTGGDIFKGVGVVKAVRYHSLHADLSGNEDLEELAWTFDNDENTRIVMALKHSKRPFWAVQYHPESVLTEGGGIEVMFNFCCLARSWNATRTRSLLPWDSKASTVFGSPWPNLLLPSISKHCTESRTVLTTTLHLPDLHAVMICELLDVTNDKSPFVMLDSAATPGRYTIIGCLHAASPHITYSIGDDFLHLQQGESCSRVSLGSHDIWSWVAAFMNQRKASGGLSNVPFWGGLVGYLSYEIGVESLSIPITVPGGRPRHPDMNLVFVERSIVLDSKDGVIYLQSILEGDEKWLADTTELLRSAAQEHSTRSANAAHPSTDAQTTIFLPDGETYKTRVSIAQEHLYAGESYELCLTAPTRISLRDLPWVPSETQSPSWQRYKLLRELNPAPHAGYLRLHPTTLVSSSPERFLSFSRPPGATFQLRPIKGTVRKGPDVTRAVAEKALKGSPKEVAENLMIVDLIRHDLHAVVGQDVDVKQFCTVEEYSTVWQLVSVIEGKVGNEVDAPDNRRANGALGWELLRRSLPPGSMTGAPKKRSVEILRTLEDGERNVYSGVFGYWCVSGAGDWSVTIRSCSKYDNRYGCKHTTGAPVDDRAEEWVIGAGGAITALSEPELEWQEMLTKLRSVLRVFGYPASCGN
ncbi:ADC synthase [Pisolithus marmoratus]|nr:ADC synthase [Pisolithus marmoratus]